MQVKLQDIIESERPLHALMGEKTSARMAFTLNLVVKELSKHFATFVDIRNALTKKYNVKLVNNRGTTENPEEQAALDAEWDGLMNTMVELVGIGQIRLSNFTGDCELSADEAQKLHWLIIPDAPLFESETPPPTPEPTPV